MAKGKIRHIALVTRDPAKLAEFYKSVFDMKEIHRGNGAIMLSDGYLTMALLQHRLTQEKTCGINHFGFVVEDQAEAASRIAAQGVEEPKPRPAERPYAEYRGCDPDGNQFDLSVHGFDLQAEGVEPDKKKALAR